MNEPATGDHAVTARQHYEPNLLPVLFWIACGLVIGVVLLVVVAYGVNVLRADQWTLVPLYKKVADGSAGLADFFRLHNEHRLLVPRLILVGTAFATGLNLKAVNVIQLGLAVLTFVGFVRIASTSVNAPRHWLALFSLIGCLLMFSLVMHRAWLDAYGVMWASINAMLCGTLLALVGPGSRRTHARLAGAAVLCSAATFSAAHGMLTWLAVTPMLFTMPGLEGRRGRWLLLWLLMAGASAALYLWGYQRVGHVPSPLTVFSHPLQAAFNALILVGMPLTGSSIELAAAFGTIFVIVYLIGCVFFVANLHGELGRTLAPWICLGLFALLFAGAVSAGRVGLGGDYVYAHRYMLTTVLFGVSVTYLVLGLLYGPRTGPRPRLQGTTPLALSYLSAGALAGHLLTNSMSQLPKVREVYVDNEHVRLCVELMHYAPDSCLRRAFPDLPELRRRAQVAEDLGFRHFPADLTLVPEPPRLQGQVEGATEQGIRMTRDRAWVPARGWAVTTGKGTPARLVLFSRDDEEGFFYSTPVHLPSKDVARARGSDRFSRARWKTEVPTEDLPDGPSTIHAWVYDPDRGLILRLRGSLRIEILADHPTGYTGD